MKKNILNVLNTMVVSTLLAPAWASAQSTGQLHQVVREGNGFKITYCDGRLGEEGKVNLVWDNNVVARANLTLHSGFVPNKICNSHTIPFNDRQLQEKRSLRVHAKNNNQVLASFTSAQITGENTNSQPTQNANYEIRVDRTNGNSRLRVRACGGDLRANETLQFRIATIDGNNQKFDNSVRQNATARTEGAKVCVEKEYNITTLSPLQGTLLVIASRGDKDLFTRDVTTVARGSAPAVGQTPTPAVPANPTNPAVPATTKPATPSRPTLEEGRAREAGSDASTWVVKYIVESLGRIERIRYNFFQGFADVQKANEKDEARFTREYHQGAQEAQRESTKILSEGIRSGQSFANQQAAARAEAEVKDRIRKTPSGQQPDFNLSSNLNFDSIINAFQGSGNYRQEAPNMMDRLAAEDREIQNQLRPLFIKPEGIILADDFFNQNYGSNQGQNIRKFQEDLVINTSRRGQNAMRGFRDNKFPSSQTNQYRAMYEAIPQQFENGFTGQMWFESGFVEKYNSMIQDEWNEAVRANTFESQESKNLGKRTYERLFRAYSLELGRVEKANEIYRDAQIQGFSESYEEAYRGHFARIAQQAQTSSLVEVLPQDVNLLVSTGDGNNLTLGDTFTVVIKKATNLGGKSDLVQVRVSGQGLVMDQEASFQIPGFDALTEEQSYVNVARIQQISTESPDSSLRITLNLSGQGINANVRSFEATVTLEGLLRKLATDANSSYTDRLVDHLQGYLKIEWEKHSGSMWGTVYNNGTGELVIERLANFYKGLQEGQKENIKRHLPKLITALNGGERPGYWTTSRDDFDAAMEILKSAGLEITKAK